MCKKCSLTKKAIEYYIEQGLVIPAMCRLSETYQEYHKKLLNADKKFVQRCPEFAFINNRRNRDLWNRFFHGQIDKKEVIDVRFFPTYNFNG